MTLTPAYGRDYTKRADVIDAFNADKDFILQDVTSRYHGKPINKAQVEVVTSQVKIRYAKLRNVVVVSHHDGYTDWR